MLPGGIGNKLGAESGGRGTETAGVAPPIPREVVGMPAGQRAALVSPATCLFGVLNMRGSGRGPSGVQHLLSDLFKVDVELCGVNQTISIEITLAHDALSLQASSGVGSDLREGVMVQVYDCRGSEGTHFFLNGGGIRHLPWM
jgi:hypothetical protein